MTGSLQKTTKVYIQGALRKYPDFSCFCLSTCSYLHIVYMTHSIHEQKLYFIAYKSVGLFSVRSVYTQSFEHLNKLGVRATMDSKLEEQRTVINSLVLEGEKTLPHFFKDC